MSVRAVRLVLPLLVLLLLDGGLTQSAWADVTITGPINNGCTTGPGLSTTYSTSYVVASSPSEFTQVDVYKLFSNGTTFDRICYMETVYSFGKSAAQRQQYQQALTNAQIGLNSVNMTGALNGGIGSLTDVIQGYIGSFVSNCLTGDLSPCPNAGRVGATIGIALTLGIASRGGLISLTAATAIAFATTYYTAKIAIAQQQLNDPPDPNYSELFTYSGATLPAIAGLSASDQQYFSTGFAQITQMLEALQGNMVSTERAWGAFAAGDVANADKQLAAAAAFAADYTRLAPLAGAWFASVPTYVSSQGADAGIADVTQIYTALETTAQELGAAPLAPLALTCPAASATVQTAYSSSVSASGGLTPYVFAIEGVLPPGLQLTATSGVIAGSPTVAGLFNFVAQVSDPLGGTTGQATTSCSLTVAPAATSSHHHHHRKHHVDGDDDNQDDGDTDEADDH